MLREEIIKKLSNPMGIKLNKEMNDNIGYGHDFSEGVITRDDSKVRFYVIPTNEEVMIVRDTYNIVNK